MSTYTNGSNNSSGRKTTSSSFGLVLISNCSLGPQDRVKCRYRPLKYGSPFLKRLFSLNISSSAIRFSIIIKRYSGENTFAVLKKPKEGTFTNSNNFCSSSSSLSKEKSGETVRREEGQSGDRRDSHINTCMKPLLLTLV